MERIKLIAEGLKDKVFDLRLESANALSLTNYNKHKLDLVEDSILATFLDWGCYKMVWNVGDLVIKIPYLHWQDEFKTECKIYSLMNEDQGSIFLRTFISSDMSYMVQPLCTPVGAELAKVIDEKRHTINQYLYDAHSSNFGFYNDRLYMTDWGSSAALPDTIAGKRAGKVRTFLDELVDRIKPTVFNPS